MTRARIEPRGLHRDSAALYVGVGLSKFSEMVADGRMPKPKIIDSRRVWDRYELDASFNDLPHDAPVNEWDSVLHGSIENAVR